MLAYYVEWHLREAWRELMFADEDQGAKATRDPVAPAKRSQAADAKASRRTLDDGTIEAEFQQDDRSPKSTAIPRSNVVRWMDSDDIEVMGATFHLLTDQRYYPLRAKLP